MPRSVIVAALILSTVVPLPAVAASDPWIEEDFDTAPRGVRALSIGHVGTGARAVIREGSHRGARHEWVFAREGVEPPEELWWRYWIRFPEGFRIEPPSRGKLPGPATLNQDGCYGGRPSTPGRPCFSARMMFSRAYQGDDPGPDDRTLLGFYTYHLDSPAHRGDIWTWNPEVATLDHGPWYCVEGHIRLNTPGSADGVLEGWVEGARAFSRDDLRFRRAGESFPIESFWFDVYYGGKAVSPADNQIHFDSLALGPARIGCNDADFDGTFSDDEQDPFEADIDWLFDQGVTDGCDTNHYCPDDPVTRAQMAALLRRAVELPATETDHFSDDEGTVFEADIDALAEAGLTHGCGEGRYCPNQPATRGQLAVFLARAFPLPKTSKAVFDDVAGTPYQQAANRLGAAGISHGCHGDGTRFCPDDPVTRGQVAAFLRRTIQAVAPPDPPPEPEPEPSPPPPPPAEFGPGDPTPA